MFGTDLASKLRAQAFQGLVLIRSANSSSEDVKGYLLGGSVDCCLGKTQSHKDVAKSILEALETKKAGMHKHPKNN